MSGSAERLERALALFVAHERQGGDWQQLLDAHPELADLLTAMRDDGAADSAAPDVDDGVAVGGYRLGRVVGEGGVGTVYEARDPRLGRRVAIKVLRPEFAASPTSLARFHREAQTLARVDHANVVRILGVGESAGRYWLAMAFVDGESLAARIERLRAAGGHAGDSLRVLVQAIADVAAALHCVHTAGIVHRDVKPSNILLRSDGAPVLTDFGIARDRDDATLTSPGALIGSPRYMAPEQVLGGGAACDARADVFSLGATLFECVALQPAFERPSIEATLAAIVQAEPVDPRRLHRGLPADLAAIVWKALEKDPAARYPTAQAMAADLRAFLELREVAARAPSRPRRWWRRLRHQPLLAALVATAAVAALSLAWIGVQWPRLHAAAAARERAAYDDLVVRGFLARDEPDAGRRWFEHALAIDPARSEAVLGLVFAVSRQQGPAAALAELEARGGSGDENRTRCRAWLLQRLQRTEAAAALPRPVGEPLTSMGLWLEALLAIEAGDPAALLRARELLSLAVRLAPQPNLILYTQWAGVACNGGSAAERREAAETLLRLWPDHPRALAIAGAALIVVDAARAGAVLQRARALGADDAEVLVNTGIAAARAGDRAAAAAALTGAFEPAGDRASLRRTVLLVLGQVDAPQADALAEEWLRREPEHPDAGRFAGRAAFRRGEAALAVERLQRAAAARPADLDLRLDLAFARAEAGDLPTAAIELGELARLHPDHERVHLQLLDVLDGLGDVAAGIDEHRRWAGLHLHDAAAWRDLAAAAAADLAAAAEDLDLTAAERANVLAGGQDAVARELHAAALARRGEQAAAARVRAGRPLQVR
ncbi:MAG: protein kinase [Planctomycetes bacterium]|nr:protein kinase [Planctomycetota bacterium]